MSKRVLVTGGAGFIGSNIVDAYIAHGWDVTVVDDLSTGKLKNVHPKANFIQCDIGHEDLSQIIDFKSFDVVNHHAAQIDVRYSGQHPEVDASVNIINTIKLLTYCKNTSVKKFIFSSSGGTVYGDLTFFPSRETSVRNPESPYGISKMSAENYIFTLCKNYDIEPIIFRYGNVYGPRQDPHGEAGVIGIFIERAIENKPLYIYGDGQAARDFVYIDDVVDLNLKASVSPRRYPIDVSDAAVNVANGIHISVNYIAQTVLSVVQPKNSIIEYKPARSGELQMVWMNVEKAYSLFGWSPTIFFEDGLRKTYEYLKNDRT